MKRPAVTINAPLQLFTIGFTQKTAETFFATLNAAGVRRIVDVRLNNTGQLAGFTKRGDLAFFLRRIGRMEYVHWPILAPTPDMLRAYRKGSSSWEEYSRAFTFLMKERQIEHAVRADVQDLDCLLCSEPTADFCHRRIVAEYLQDHWKDLRIQHL